MCSLSTANKRCEMVWLPTASANTAKKKGAPCSKKAVLEKKLCCSKLKFSKPLTKAVGPPIAYKTAGIITTAMAINATNCTKSVNTAARKPDQKRSEERRVGKEC